jgi:hypothetical protein
MNNEQNIIQRMESLALEWENRKDPRAIFLRCYSMMSANMMDSINAHRFQNKEWVWRLLHRFADYYFDALACFDCGEAVPPVWQKVHNISTQKKLHVLQHLLLGVNAHINYDLVLTLYDMLAEEWDKLSIEERKSRYLDHVLVNTIIAETIDKVQDEVVEQYSPAMNLIDKAMGRLDEKILVGLISKWRASVWENALIMINSPDDEQKEAARQKLEIHVLKTCDWLEADIWAIIKGGSTID